MGISFSRIIAGAKEVATADKLSQVLGLIQDQTQRVAEQAAVHVDPATAIVRVDTASGTRTYTVKDTDQHIVGITNGGPLTVSLPSPANKRTLGVIGSGANKVTVQRSDGKAMSFGQVKELQDSASLFTSDGTDWYLG